jgi:hypothetical protein
LNLRHRSLVQADGKWVGADQGARPHSYTLPGGSPRGSVSRWRTGAGRKVRADVRSSLVQNGGYTAKGAEAAARSLLPDFPPYDLKRPAAYPGNGRMPGDDAKDVFLIVFQRQAGIGQMLTALGHAGRVFPSRSAAQNPDRGPITGRDS